MDVYAEVRQGMSMTCSQNGCMNYHNHELAQLVKIAGLEVWIYRCDEHAKKHTWVRLGGTTNWYCWGCRTEVDGEKAPPAGPCVKREEVRHE